MPLLQATDDHLEMSELAVELGNLEAGRSEQKLASTCDVVPDLTGELYSTDNSSSRNNSNKGSPGYGNVCVASVDTEDVKQMDISTLIGRLIPVADRTPRDSFVMEQAKDPAVHELLQFIERGHLPEDDHRARKIAFQQSLFAVVEGVLYYVDPKRNNHRRVVVPGHLQRRILE